MSESKSDALTNLATPLHRSQLAPPTFKPRLLAAPTCRLALGPAGERMAPQRAAHPARPARGPIARHRCRRRRAVPARANTALPEPVMRLLPKARPKRGRRALTSGQRPSAAACRSLRPKPSASSGPVSRCPPGSACEHRIGFGKARDSSSGDALGHRRAGEDGAGREGGGGLDDGEPRRRDRDRRAGARRCLRRSRSRRRGRTARRRRAPRPIGSSRVERPVEPPEPVQCEQRRGRVRAAAAEAGTPRHALVDRDVGAQRRCRCAPAARARRAGRGRRPAARRARSWRARAPSSRRSKCSVSHQSISTISDSSRCIAVVAPADDVQEQVELGRRRNVVERATPSRATSYDRSRRIAHA